MCYIFHGLLYPVEYTIEFTIKWQYRGGRKCILAETTQNLKKKKKPKVILRDAMG